MEKRKYKSIRTQMLAVLLLIIILLSAGILGFTSITLSQQYDKQINQDNQSITSLMSNNLQGFMEKAYAVTNELAENDTIIAMNGTAQAKVLQNCAARYDFIELLFVQDTTGMQIARSSGDCGDRSDRWWFPLVNDQGLSFVTKSYLSASTGNPVCSILMPVKDGNRIVGSIGMDISLDYMQQMIEENSDQESGRYSFVLDGEGVVIAHPDSQYVSEMYNLQTATKQVDGAEQSIDVCAGYQTMMQNAMNGAAGSLSFVKDGIDYYGAYQPVTISGDSDQWYIITIQDEKAAKSIITDIVRRAGMTALIMLVVAGVLIVLFANTIARPIRDIAGLLSKTALGDFTGTFHTKSKTEIGLLADSYNEMVQNIASLVSNTREIAGNIHESVEVLNDISSSATEAAENIKESANEILTGTTDQAVDAEKSAELNSTLNEQFASLAVKTNAMVEEAQKASEVTEEGSEKVQVLKEKNLSTYAMIEKTAQAIEGLNQESQVIGSILKTLDNISEETNLLSLNASIEAARAGEHGKSFAVVAEEIQKLSMESASSTANIEKIISRIQEQIAASVSMMEEIKAVSTEQNDAVANVNHAFDQIQDTSTAIAEFISEMEEFVQEMQGNNDLVVSSITNIAAITEETAACTETVTQSIAHQTDEIGQIASHAEELKQKAELLEEEISKFQI